MGASNWVHIEVALIMRETEKAFQVELASGEQMWLPKSQICDADNYEAGDADLSLAVTQWLAEQKELDT